MEQIKEYYKLAKEHKKATTVIAIVIVVLFLAAI